MQITWQKCFGGTEDDVAFDIVEIPDGYFITGYTWSNDGDVSFNKGLLDGWVIKTDSFGNILWEKTYGGSSGDGFRRIIPDNNGNYFLVGSSGSSDGDISNDPYPDSEDFWIVKIDMDGNIIWDKIVGGSNGGEHIWSASPTLDGGVLAVGWTYSNDGDVSVSYGGGDTWAVKISSEGELEWDYNIGTDWIDKGQAILATSDGGYLIASNSIILEDAIGNITCTPHSYGWTDGVLFKLDSNLNVEWQHCYGGSDHDGIYGIFELEDGYIFSAYTTSNDGDVSGYHADADIWLVRIDYEGNIIWEHCFGGYDGEIAYDIFPSENNGFIIAGQSSSNDGDVSGNHSMSEYDNDIWMFKIDSEGELLWQQCFGGAGSDAISGIRFGVVQKNDNNYVIATTTDYGPSYDVACTPHGGNGVDEDWWVFELKDCDYYAPSIPTAPCGADTVCSAGGNQTVFTTTAAANASGYEWLLAPEDAGTITGDSLLGKASWNENYEGTATVVVRSVNDCGASEWSEPKYTQVYTCLGTEETAAESAKLKVYPNPARAFVVFACAAPRPPEGGAPPTVQIFNVYGRQVANVALETEKTVWDCSKMPDGLYLYTTEWNGKVLSGKLVIRK